MDQNEVIAAAMEAAVSAGMECRYEMSVEYAEAALEAIDAQPDPDLRVLEEVLGVLGTAAHYGGYYAQAEVAYTRLLKLTEELYGQHLEYAQVLADIGTLLVETSRYDEAEPYLWKAGEIYQGRLRGLRLQYGEVLDLLAICVEGDNSNYALTLVKESIQVMEGLFASDLQLVSPLRRLAKLYAQAGEMEKASEAQSRADEIYADLELIEEG